MNPTTTVEAPAISLSDAEAILAADPLLAIGRMSIAACGHVVRDGVPCVECAIERVFWRLHDGGYLKRNETITRDLISLKDEVTEVIRCGINNSSSTEQPR